MGTRMWTDEHLLRAVATEQSWRGVMRALGLKSSSSMRIVQQHADRLKLDTSHFSGQRRWSDQELREAVADCDSWSEVAEHLRLNSDRRTGIRLRGHAMRLGLDVAHITQQHQPLDRPPSKAYDTGSPRLAELRRAAPSIAAAFFALRGLAVAIPHDQQEYDLLITTDEGIQRVQVKTPPAGLEPEPGRLVLATVPTISTRQQPRIRTNPMRSTGFSWSAGTAASISSPCKSWPASQ